TPPLTIRWHDHEVDRVTEVGAIIRIARLGPTRNRKLEVVLSIVSFSGSASPPSPLAAHSPQPAVNCLQDVVPTAQESQGRSDGGLERIGVAQRDRVIDPKAIIEEQQQILATLRIDMRFHQALDGR